MKIEVEVSEDDVDDIIIATMRDIRKYEAMYDTSSHPDDKKLRKRVRKAAKVILEYYS